MKFLSKKSSLQVRSVKFNSGRMPIPVVGEESMKEQKCQYALVLPLTMYVNSFITFTISS